MEVREVQIPLLSAIHREVRCGCVADRGTSARRGLATPGGASLPAAARAPMGPPPRRPPHPGAEAGRLLAILAVELAVIAALSPELGESLARFGYSEPCELRRLPAVRTLTALRRSSQWRRRSGVITAEVPVDMWREPGWRDGVVPPPADRPAA